MRNDDTREQLVEERRIIEAATGGPWGLSFYWSPPGWVEGTTYTRVVAGEPNPISGIKHVVVSTNGAPAGSEGRAQGDADAAFIAHARTAMPVRNAQVAAVLDYADRIEGTLIPRFLAEPLRQVISEAGRAIEEAQ